MAMLRKKHSWVREFSHDCLARYLGYPRNVVLLLVDQDHYQLLTSWARVPPTRTDQPLDPKQPRFFGSHGHKMLLTGTLAWISAWLEQAASVPPAQGLEVLEAHEVAR
jgi:hypothetical protein